MILIIYTAVLNFLFRKLYPMLKVSFAPHERQFTYRTCREPQFWEKLPI